MEYSEDELKSRLISSFVHPEDRKLTSKYREKLLENTPLVNFENRYISKSGRIVWLQWSTIPLTKEGLFYAIAKDITHYKNLEKERNELIAQLSQKNEKLKNHNYSTSHDLRSPLNNILALVSLIDGSMIEDEQTKEILNLISASANGLKNTMNSYLDHYKQLDISDDRLEPVNFGHVLQKVQTSIGSLIQKSSARFQVDFSDMESVMFRTNFMESIFLNLITNSIKYARPGVAPSISITSSQLDGKASLVYSDNGLGIDMKSVGHLIFKLNEQFHGHTESKGIGLYLVHNQITSLGGTISVDSTVNKGTTFTITF